MKTSIPKFILFTFLLILCMEAQSCKLNQEAQTKASYVAFEKKILVDADTLDWKGISSEVVKKKSHLWVGQRMKAKNWLGSKDLSYTWRAVWRENKVYFLFVVTDDKISPFDRPNTWLNDCIEICLDPKLSRGIRKEISNGVAKLNGYETHFLPMQPPHAFIHDDGNIYFVANQQDTDFKNQWNGEMAVSYTKTGYIMELAFSIPTVNLQKNSVIGLEVAVCDDDGESRKNLLTWTGIQNDYWIKMDKYGEIHFK